MRRRRRAAAGGSVIRAVIVDDAPLERAIVARFAALAGHEVVGEAESLTAASALLEACGPDVAIVDGRLGLGVIAAIAAWQHGATPPAVLAIASVEEAAFPGQALAAGAAGVVARPVLPRKLATAFERLARTRSSERE